MLQIEKVGIGFVVRDISPYAKYTMAAGDKLATALKVLVWLGFDQAAIQRALVVLGNRASKLPDPRDGRKI